MCSFCVSREKRKIMHKVCICSPVRSNSGTGRVCACAKHLDTHQWLPRSVAALGQNNGLGWGANLHYMSCSLNIYTEMFYGTGACLLETCWRVRWGEGKWLYKTSPRLPSQANAFSKKSITASYYGGKKAHLTHKWTFKMQRPRFRCPYPIGYDGELFCNGIHTRMHAHILVAVNEAEARIKTNRIMYENI